VRDAQDKKVCHPFLFFRLLLRERNLLLCEINLTRLSHLSQSETEKKKTSISRISHKARQKKEDKHLTRLTQSETEEEKKFMFDYSKKVIAIQISRSL
jgi:hypothetical protein